MSTRTREREDEDENVREKAVESVPAPPIGEEIANLPVQVSFVVPSTRGGDVVDRDHFEKRIKFTREWFDTKFGGDTTIRASGGYLGDDELITEPVAVVESSMSVDSYMAHKDEFAQFVKERQRSWDQDTVLYAVEGRKFIYPKREYLDDGDDVPPGIVMIS